jgi:uncharacterized protein YkwD
VALAAGNPRHDSAGGRHVRVDRRRPCSRSRASRTTASSRACVASLRKGSAGSGRRHHRAPAHSSTPAQAAGARAAAIARALATTCENTRITPEAANLELARAAVVCLINHQRAQNGEMPLAVDSRLASVANSHVEELVANDYFAHVSPSGVTPVDRIRATGYIPGPESGYLIGENLAWGTLTLSTPQAIVEAWMASPDHRANILESRYVDTGIGIAPAVPASFSGGSQGATYAQEFGTIIA